MAEKWIIFQVFLVYSLQQPWDNSDGQGVWSNFESNGRLIKNERLWAEASLKIYISPRQNLFRSFSRKKHDEVSQVV